ncbi:hypothetical protein HaLaN_02484 [Haematococcus lacustris]|uniref:Uncharacterized protein n=1 Tax=Haematococcus lacustris TaxID=44745 RepID=A0A699YC78_HAELA|nr:hypothetical protein HaLaN_02484 [Haematococcus lacustris]
MSSGLAPPAELLSQRCLPAALCVHSPLLASRGLGAAAQYAKRQRMLPPGFISSVVLPGLVGLASPHSPAHLGAWRRQQAGRRQQAIWGHGCLVTGAMVVADAAAAATASCARACPLSSSRLPQCVLCTAACQAAAGRCWAAGSGPGSEGGASRQSQPLNLAALHAPSLQANYTADLLAVFQRTPAAAATATPDACLTTPRPARRSAAASPRSGGPRTLRSATALPLAAAATPLSPQTSQVPGASAGALQPSPAAQQQVAPRPGGAVPETPTVVTAAAAAGGQGVGLGAPAGSVSRSLDFPDMPPPTTDAPAAPFGLDAAPGTDPETALEAGPRLLDPDSAAAPAPPPSQLSELQVPLPVSQLTQGCTRIEASRCFTELLVLQSLGLVKMLAATAGNAQSAIPELDVVLRLSGAMAGCIASQAAA